MVSHIMNQRNNSNGAKAPTRAQKQTSKGKSKRQDQIRSRRLDTNPIRRGADTGLTLTRSQFTATSPQVYWEFVKASTPGGLRVRGRELIGSAITTGAITGSFALLNVASETALTLSPVAFPRLGQIAPAFSQFIFHKANILFQSNQPTTATGEVLIAVNYDYNASQPTSSQIMMRNVSSTMANIYSDASCQVLKDLSRFPRFYVSEPGSPDNTLIYQAAVYAAVEGVTAASGASLGYLAIEYDCEFFTPN